MPERFQVPTFPAFSIYQDSNLFPKEFLHHCGHTVLLIRESDIVGDFFYDILRIGHGYDVHRLVEGRRCIIGGVDIPYERGLLGHSDADVLAHALADAILGACRGGDIGKLFPDTDPTYEGADSMVLLARVMDYARELGFEFVDADCTIACQQPKITPHRDAMRANLAHALGVDVENVGVAATTTEKLGWEGQGEGIGAWAVCLLQKTVKE